ncbi:hypothetical protein [Synechococcus phage BUCT-ZZ01]|nr:hypothetical protein [Synechococcus phage BUCT-ZZ01]
MMFIAGLIFIYVVSMITSATSIIYMVIDDGDGLTFPEIMAALACIFVPIMNTIVAVNAVKEIAYTKGWGNKRYFVRKKK